MVGDGWGKRAKGEGVRTGNYALALRILLLSGVSRRTVNSEVFSVQQWTAGEVETENLIPKGSRNPKYQ